MPPLDATHDPELSSWVPSANTADTDFPIQNLPFGRFKVADDPEWRIGVAIGDQVLDLRGAGLLHFNDMNRLIRLSREPRQALRQRLSAGLATGSACEAAWTRHLHVQADVALGLPCDIRDYSDFYVGIHHATAVGQLFRPDNPLLPNYKWVPIGYHGRASTLLPSGVDFHRPMGQTQAAHATEPALTPTQRLDLELELGFVVGRPNAVGHRIAVQAAEDHVFGVTLFNDWSARDLQAWEYQPLGPFLSKSFASTVSPWMVTLDALAPFRRPLQRAPGDPPPLPYLSDAHDLQHGALDIDLAVLLQTATMRQHGLAPEVIARSNAATASHWTLAQLVAHHTVNGCALAAGDLLGSGTLSGPGPGQAGSLLELTQGGTQPIRLANGQTRLFLEDGDSITLRGSCQRPGFRRLGFGACTATVLPSLPWEPSAVWEDDDGAL